MSVMDGGATHITIGELARRTGLSVRTLRFDSDRGHWQLLAVINGWPRRPATVPAWEWLAQALRDGP